MSIAMTLLRLTATGYDHARDTGTVPAEVASRDDVVEKRWAVLDRILAGPDPTHPAVAAQATTGGRVLPNAPGDYGGPRLLDPSDVSTISSELADVTDDDIVERYGQYDFTGLYGTEGSRPAGRVEHYVLSFHHVRDFYAESAQEQAAMVIRIG